MAQQLFGDRLLLIKCLMCGRGWLVCGIIVLLIGYNSRLIDPVAAARTRPVTRPAWFPNIKRNGNLPAYKLIDIAQYSVNKHLVRI